jgi:hypothetical protein
MDKKKCPKTKSQKTFAQQKITFFERVHTFDKNDFYKGYLVNIQIIVLFYSIIHMKIHNS